jgi:hypothetical protein
MMLISFGEIKSNYLKKLKIIINGLFLIGKMIEIDIIKEEIF